MIFVNFKTYAESTGENGRNLLKILAEVSKETQVKIVAAVQTIDLREAVANSTLEIWSQKIDSDDQGAHTGTLTGEAVVDAGVLGTFLNHSESKMQKEDLVKALGKAKALSLKTLIFAADLEELKEVLALKPTYASYEPPELIGRSDISVATAQPEIIAKASVLSKEAGIPLIVGAGIGSGKDVKKSVELGSTGVAVASYVIKAKDQKAAILDLAEGFK
jgi:triosephosphate isomerase